MTALARVEDVAALTAALVLAALLVTCGTGCVASHVRLHAEGAAIATVAIEGAQEAQLSALERAMDACAGDGASECLTAARVASKPIESALDVADLAVRSWRDAIEVALIAHESDALLSALMTAGLRVLARWADARAIAAPLGFDLPALTLPGLEVE